MFDLVIFTLIIPKCSAPDIDSILDHVLDSLEFKLGMTLVEQYRKDIK